MHRHFFREFKTISMHCIINVGDRSRPHDCSVCWVISTGHMPQVKSMQVTAPSINYQTTKITLDLIEYQRLELGGTFNNIILCVSLYHGDLYSSLRKSHLYLRPPIFSVLDMIKQGLFIKELCPAMNNDTGLDLVHTCIGSGYYWSDT